MRVGRGGLLRRMQGNLLVNILLGTGEAAVRGVQNYKNIEVCEFSIVIEYFQRGTRSATLGEKLELIREAREE